MRLTVAVFKTEIDLGLGCECRESETERYAIFTHVIVAHHHIVAIVESTGAIGYAFEIVSAHSRSKFRAKPNLPAV